MMKNIVKIGNVNIGGNQPVTVQSMTSTDTADFNATLNQLLELKRVGCDIARIAVRDEIDVSVCKKILSAIDIPLVADIQYDYKLAVACADVGFHKIRYNPGNTSTSGLNELVSACKANNCPIRIGVNGGSLEKDIKQKHGGASASALVESAMRSIKLLEDLDFYDIVVSVKSSDIRVSSLAYRMLYESSPYPLHVGITESGIGDLAIIKSSIGIGSLLLDGIGDTIRVSLTGDPIQEVLVAKNIIKATSSKKNFVEIVSCPTCARCNYDLERIAKKAEALTNNINKKLKIAIMGCTVNGPGEASDADLGIAGGKDKAVVFKNGKILLTARTEDAEEIFFNILRELISD